MTALLMAYRDIEGARQFFVDALGFEETWVVAEDGGKVTRSHVEFGDTVLMLDSQVHTACSTRATRAA